MRIDVITLFPDLIRAGTSYSMVKRAQEDDILQICVTDPRDFTTDRHRTVDDSPFGGGPGMVMKIEPIEKAVAACRQASGRKGRVLLTEPQGKPMMQADARRWAEEPSLIIVCGHYGGVDQRVADYLADESVSIGDYVLTGGELPALVIIDAVTRLLPGVLGNEESAEKDSFEEGLLGYPQYTRPEVHHGWRVPEVLLSGHHEAIQRWRRAQQLLRTRRLRPDLFARAPITGMDVRLMAETLRGDENESG